MSRPRRLRVVLIKPSKYDAHGYVERFRWGFMPNGTLPFLRSMTPSEFEGTPIEVTAVDEYVHTDLRYLTLLRRADDAVTLLALAGVQSHQFPRALDLTAFAKSRGVEHCVIGGPHPMTCDTTVHHHRGVSFALAEADLVWPTILRDAIQGELQPVYGQQQRWQTELDSPALIAPSRVDLRRYFVPMLGVYPARGCPFRCNFCSVIKIAGHRVRSQSIDTTLESLANAKKAGVKLIVFTSDNFNKYAEAKDLLRAMIEARIGLPFFVQCDTQVAKDEELVELLGRAGCFQMFLGVEAFDPAILRAAKKFQNRPEDYGTIVKLCTTHGIGTHFANIIGFPEHTERGILEQLSVLRSLRPTVASFYILTPIPGTEQYDDFLARGLITVDDLNAFDASRPIWRHPTLSGPQLQSLLFRCYREFYSYRSLVTMPFDRLWKRHPWYVPATTTGFGVLCRSSARRKMHPMAGGVRRLTQDRVADYLPSRVKTFGAERFPLPRSLPLSEADQHFNRFGKVLKPVAV